MSSRYRGAPWRPEQVPTPDLGLLGDPNQVTPLSPQELGNRQPVLDSAQRFDDSVRLQDAAQAPPSGLAGIISSPIFQLAIPTALSALSAIMPRTMGPAGAIGMAGFRSVTDLNQQNIQNKRSTTAEIVKQRLADLEAKKLGYALNNAGDLDPGQKDAVQQLINTGDNKGAAMQMTNAANESTERSRVGAMVENPPTPKPGQSISASGGGMSTSVQGQYPKEPPAPKPPKFSQGVQDIMNAYPAEPGEDEAAHARRALKLQQDRDVEKSKASRDNPSIGGLHPKIATMVESRQNKFRSEPVVKRIQTQAEAVDFVNHLDPNSKSPADDQALIYSFAKAMDPDSVVREGEYAVVQKYSQSWLERFGFSAKRVVENQEFLTPQAREMMKSAIRTKYAAGLRQYQNIKKGYATQINMLTKGEDGEQYLLSYEDSFPPTEAPPAQQPDPQGRPPLSDFMRP